VTPKRDLKIFISAGEASGDAHAASLVRAMRQTAPDLNFSFFGSTLNQMRNEGVHSIVDADQLSIMGLYEVGTALPRFWEAYKQLKSSIITNRPDLAILVDWPDFNLRLARFLRKKGFRVIYYISPQLWAWRSYRVRNLRRDVDLLLCILPFEPDWYSSRGFEKAEFIGHPLTAKIRAVADPDHFCAQNGLDKTRPIISLLPGSRHKELERILPVMVQAALKLLEERPDVQFVIALSQNRSVDEVGSLPQSNFRILKNVTREVLSVSTAAAIASGTATLEAALLQVPMVVVYKESMANWHLLRPLINTDHFALPNLIAGKRIVSELIQYDFRPEDLAVELKRLLKPEENLKIRNQLGSIIEMLGSNDASEIAAHKIISRIRAWR
jgi:lipid-A-disaccharide synthase